MLHRRSTAFTALILAVPAAATLTSCGFDYPTDRVNTIAAGANNRDATVDALGIRVVATADGTGRLIGSLANNTDDDAALTTVAGDAGSVTAELEPVTVEGNSEVNLAEDVTIPVTGDFTAGDVISLALTFDTDESVALEVPVVKACGQYADIEVPAGAEAGGSAGEGGESESDPASESESESEDPAEEATDEAAEAAEEEAEHEAEEDAVEHEAEDGGDATYLCDHPSEGGHDEGGH